MSSVIGRHGPGVDEKGRRTVRLLCRRAEGNEAPLRPARAGAGTPLVQDGLRRMGAHGPQLLTDRVNSLGVLRFNSLPL